MLAQRSADGFFPLCEKLAQRDLDDRALGDIVVNGTVA